jgi:FkbM family methyltransferase
MQLPGNAFTVQLNNHVKTVIKLSERVLKVNIHNSKIRDGNYILEDGSIFLEEKSRESRSIISDTLENVQLPDYFIFHAAYRTEREYISRLLRGRGHANDSRIIKQNRMGYLPEPNSKSMNWEIMYESRHEYLEEYKVFIDKCSLGKFLQETKYIDYEVEKFVELICQNKDLIPASYQQFRGINFQALSLGFGTTNTIKFAIDLAKYSTDDGLKVVGWCYDWFYPELEISSYLMASGIKIPISSFHRLERSDVVKVFLDAPHRCGFSLGVPAGEVMELKDVKLFLTNGINTTEIEFNTEPKAVPTIMSHESYLRGIDLFRDLELASLKNYIETIFDVGANTGQSCAEYLQHWPSAKIYCFEPSPKVFKVLSDRYGHNNRVELLKLGLSDSCTNKTLVEEDISVNNYLIEGATEGKAMVVVDCEVKRGDCFTSENKLPGIDFLKIDTEGHDLRVLQGFYESLEARIIGLIQCEVSMSKANPKHVYFQDVLDFIKPFDFEIFGFYEQIRTPGQEFLRRANLVLINYDYFQSTFPKLV